MQTTQTLTTTTQLTTAEAAVVGGMLGTIFTISMIVAVLLIIAGWKIFEKAGEKGWKILIPIYDCYILFKICGIKNWFWVMFCGTIIASIMMTVNTPAALVNVSANADYNAIFSSIDWSQHVPYIIGLIASCVISLATVIAVSIKLAKDLGKGVGYTLGLIFLPNIFTLILGFGKAKYNAKKI